MRLQRRKLSIPLMERVGVLTSIALLVCAASAASADSIVVTSLDDAGVGTLREAITLAEATPEADEILFSVSGTVNLTSILPSVTTPIEVDSNGQSVVLDGSLGSDRAFFIGSGGDLRLSGFTMQGFSEPSNFGGAFGVIGGGALTLDGMTVRDNSAIAGGAIYAQDNNSRIDIFNSSFTGNTAQSGGVMFVQAGQGQVTIVDSMFQTNSANQGGVIAAINGFDVSIDNADFTMNRADFFAGDPGNSGEGAVMWLRNGGTVTTINHSRFIQNTADREAGVLLASLGVPITAEDSVFTDNTAGDDGGAFQLQLNADLILRRSHVLRNTTTTTGGGVNMANPGTSVTLENTVLSENTAANAGGGINSQESDIIITGSLVSGNIASASGGGVNAVGGSLAVENSTISGNESGATGGGLNVNNGAEATVDSATIAFNTAGGSGGGIRFAIPDESDAEFELLNTIVSDNESTSNPDSNNATGPITSLGHNLIGDAGLSPSTPSDLLNAIADLMPLADNGGLTPTHALGPLSHAIDAGATSLPTDQRGFPRPFSAATDVGAVEQTILPNPDIAAPFGEVEFLDLLAFLSFADSANLANADVTQDGQLDANDLLLFSLALTGP